MSTKARLLEEMRGAIFGGEIAWFASHFYENSTPNCEGCESKKCMFAGNARVCEETWSSDKYLFSLFSRQMHESKKNTLSTPQISPKNFAKRAINLKELKKQNIETYFTTRNARINVLQPTYRRAPMRIGTTKNHPTTFVEEWLSYSEPGSNRHRFPYRCLRPTRLPIPPSEHHSALVVRT